MAALALLALALTAVDTARAEPFIAQTVPNLLHLPNYDPTNDPNGCNLCHSPGLQAVRSLNTFGRNVFKTNALHFQWPSVDPNDPNDPNLTSPETDQITWGPWVASDDADGDTVSNGWELQDPTGASIGGSPGVVSLVTDPGDKTSVPPIIKVDPSSIIPPSIKQGESPASASFTVSNIGGPTLNATVGDNQPWLSESLAGGVCTITFPTASALPVGDYPATIEVSQVGGGVQPAFVLVTLHVLPRCGNNVVEPGEQCDDGNTSADDCCSSDCQLAPATKVCRASTDVCDPEEKCTDGTGKCPADTSLNDLSSCDLGPNACTVDGKCINGACTGSGSVCGDGKLQTSCGETCDDGNTLSGDCCSAGCKIESSAQVCRPAKDGCDVDDRCDGTLPRCQDDAKQSRGVACDDGNQCTVGDTCNGHGICAGGPACGDGITEAFCGEQCDDANGCCSRCKFQLYGSVCRPANGTGCDVPEWCSGTSSQCPADVSRPEGTFCAEDKVCSDVGQCQSPPSALLSKTQSACIASWEKAAGAAAKARAKQIRACVGTAVKGKLAGSVGDCVGIPPSQTSAAIARADSSARAKCARGEAPKFGLGIDEDLRAITDDKIVSAFEDVFGPDLDSVPSAKKPVGSCQDLVAKQMVSCLGSRFDAFNRCVRDESKVNAIRSFVKLQDCLDFEDKTVRAACTPLNSRVLKRLDKTCKQAPADLGAGFAGCLPAGSKGSLAPADLYACVDRASACRTCQMIKTWSDLNRNCDLVDDGIANGSCD